MAISISIKNSGGSMEGWIKLYRKLWQSDMFARFKNKSNMILVFVWWLTHCRDGKCTYGLRQIADDTGLSKSAVNRAVQNIVKAKQEVKHQAGHLFSTVLILNWGKYQDKPKQEAEQKENGSETEAGHNKNKNKNKEYNTIESVEPLIGEFQEKYPRIKVAEEYESIASWVHAKGKEKAYKNFKAMFNGCLLRKNKELPAPAKRKDFMIGEEGYVEI